MSSACFQNSPSLALGSIVGDRNYHSPKTTEELAKSMGVDLLAPTPPRKEILLPEGVPC